ncbi:MAG TPA: flagellar basal body L-ring protein FlgH [Terriglobales bacterium]|jgi:flagellar L-ring protein precursor FlgH|nr:flagellar basal body L-ring protein FlgH [Terriglobales bacterium]
MKVTLCCMLLASAVTVSASSQKATDNNLAKYLERVQLAETSVLAHTLGSAWSDNGRMASLTSDYKARSAGDLITILVVHDLSSSSTGAVSTDRSFKASSGVDSLPGRLKTTGVANLFGLHSAETLAGKGQATSTSTLRTSLTGRVVSVLPSGNLVVEAERSIMMNNERQNIVVRGVVRPGDVSSENTVQSNTLGNLELEIKGKGIVSDGTRPPHSILRFILRVLNF